MPEINGTLSCGGNKSPYGDRARLPGAAACPIGNGSATPLGADPVIGVIGSGTCVMFGPARSCPGAALLGIVPKTVVGTIGATIKLFCVGSK